MRLVSTFAAGAALFVASASIANVTVTPGTTSASADTAANATSPAFTTLPNIVLTEGANNDFATPQSGVTLKLDAPSGWQFNAGIGSVSAVNGKDVTATGPNQPTINVTASQITVTFSVSGSTKADVLTISGIQVQPTNGGTTTNGDILRNAGSTSNIAGVTGATNFGTLSVTVGAAKQLTVQTHPSPTATAGIAFGTQPQVQVRDQFGTLRTTDNSTVVTAARDGFGTAALQGTLTATASAGVATFTNLAYDKAETMNIVFTSGPLTSATSNNVVVSAGSVASLVFTTQPGNATAGSAFGIQPVVQTADAFGNPTTTGLAASQNVTVIISTGTGAFDPSSTTTLDIGTGAGNGTVTYTDLRIDASGSKQLSAQSPGYADGVSSAFTVNATAATHLAVIAPATVTAGNAFSVTVNALDQFDNVATSYAGTVHFTSTDGAAVLPADSTLPSGTGTFSVTLKTTGSRTITATDTNDNTIAGTSNSITVNAAAATHFSIAAPATRTAGVAFNFTITALDQFNNIATGYAGTVHFTSNDGQAVLPANTTLASGVGTFSATLKTVGPRTITGTDTVTSSITGTSNTVTISAAAASHFSVSAPASTTAGNSFSITVTALDPFSNVDTTYAGIVHFTSTDGNPTLPGDSTLVSGSNTFSVTLRTAGPRTITATDTVTGSINGTSASITVNPAAATHLSVAAPPSTIAGSAFSITVTALDQFNNTATGYAGSVHFTSSDVQAVLPANSTLASGVGAFSVTLKTAASQNVTATDTVTGSINGTSNLITVNPAAATHLGVGAPPSATAGNAFNVTVTALDQFNNTATGYTGTVHFTSTDGQAVLPTNSTLASGVGTFSVTLKTAGGRTVTATDTVTGSITGTSASITVNPASATHFTVGAPASSTAGSGFSVTVTALDAFNNTATGYSGTVVFTSSDAQAVLPGNSPLASGAGTVSATLKTAGAQSVIATDTVSGSITGSASVTVNATTATKLAFTTQPGNATAGVVFGTQPVVKTQDAFGNNSTVGLANNVQITIALTTGTGPLQGTVTINIGNNGPTPGTITFTNLRIDNAQNTKQLTVTGGGFTPGASNTFTINPAATTALTVTAPATATAGVAFSVTVTAHDQFANTTPAYAGTVHFTSNDGGAILPTDSTLASGSSAFSVTLTTAGSRTVVATDTVTASITGTASVSVGAGTPATIIKTGGNGQTIASGSSTTASVHVIDGFNNVVPSANVTFTITGGNGTVNSGAVANVSTNVSGDASATWTFGPIAGPQQMTATAGTGSATFNGTAVCTYTSKASGNWSSPSTWIGECVPAASDAVTIASGHTVTVDVNSSAASLTFAAASADSNLNLANGVTLTVAGAIALNTPAANQTTESLNVGSGTLNAASITISGAGGQKTSQLTVSSGTMNISGSISFPGNPPTQLFTSTGIASVNIGGDFNAGGSLNFNPSTTLTFNGAGAQSIGSYNPNNAFPIVNINKTNAVTMAGNLTIAGNLLIQSGTFNAGNNNLFLGGNLVDNSTFTSAGTVQFNGTSPQQITGSVTTEAFTNVTMNNAAGLTLVRPITVSGALTFMNGNIATGATMLTLFSTGMSSRTSGHVIGNYVKEFAAAGSKTFETGTSNGYSPVTATTSGATTMTIVTTQGAHPNAPTIDALQRYWTIGSTNAINASLTFNYLAGDVVGVESAYAIANYNGAWSYPGGTVDAVNHAATVNGVTAFGDFTLHETASTIVISSVNGGVNPIAGTPFNVAINTVDSLGHAAPVTSNTAITLSLTSGTSSLSGNLTANVAAGSSSTTINGVVYTKAETITVAANGGALTQGSATFTVDAASATHVSVVPNPTAQTAGVAVNATVTAQDAYNNTATSYSGTVHFTSSDAQAVLPASSTLASGVGTFPATLKTAGIQSITATDTNNASITGSGNVAVTAAAADHLLLSAPATATSGSAFSITVTALDVFGNTANSYSGTIHFTSSDGTAMLPANYTFTGGDAGTHFFSAATALNTMGSESLTATDMVTASITGTANVTVNAGSLDHFRVEAAGGGNIGAQNASVPFNIMVTALDSSDNVVSSFNGSANITSTGNLVVGAGATPNFSSGVLASYAVSISNGGIFTITATSGAATGTSNSFNIGGLSDLAVTLAGTTSLLPGDTGSYTISVQNNGPSDASSVVISLNPPAGWTLSNLNGCASLPCNAGTLTNGSTKIITFTLTVPFNAGGSFGITASATTSASDPTPANNSSNITVNVAGVSCPALVAPASPLNGESAPTSGFIRWTAANADTYDIYLGVAGSGCNTLVATTNTQQYFYSGLQPNTVYEWHIVAKRTGCTSVATSCIRFHTPPDCKGATQLVLAAVVEISAGSTYHVTWDAVDAARYEVQEALDESFTNPTTTQTDTTSVAFSHDVAHATRYFYRARAVVSCPGGGEAPWSSTTRVVVQPSQPGSNREFDIAVENGSGGTVDQNVTFGGTSNGNSNASTLAATDFVATSDQQWLTVSPSSGSIPPSGVTLTMSANTKQLPAGTSVAMVRIATFGGDTIDNVKVSVQSLKAMHAGGKSVPPPNSAIIPGVAHTSGIDARWQSDVRIFNPSSASARYALLFTPSQQDGSLDRRASEIEVAPKSTVALDDVVRHAFGYGAFGDEAAAGVLEVRPETEVAPIIASRTYSVTANGTYGDYFPAFTIPQFASPGTTLSLQQIAQSSKYHTNLGLIDASGSGGDVQVRVVDDSGHELNRFDITLAPFEHAQFDSYLQQRGVSLADGRIEVDVKSQNARIAAYAAVIDSSSNDPLLVPAAAPSQISATRYVIPAVASHTDVRVYNPSNASVTVTLTFNNVDPTVAPQTKNVTLAAGQVAAYDDVLQSLFNLSNTTGTIHVTTSKLTSLVVTARTYDAKSGATYGQFIPAVTSSGGTTIGGRALEILHVEESPVYRANVGVFEIAGNSATVQLTATLADGRIATRNVDLAPFQFVQFDSLLESLGFTTGTNARVTLRVIAGDGRVAGYASLIDNRTKDPTYVPAQ